MTLTLTRPTTRNLREAVNARANDLFAASPPGERHLAVGYVLWVVYGHDDPTHSAARCGRLRADDKAFDKKVGDLLTYALHCRN